MIWLRTVAAFLLATSTVVCSFEASARTTIAPIVEQIVPTVVSIAVRGDIQEDFDPLLSDPFFRKFFGLAPDSAPSRRGFQSTGSGVVVDAKRGYILTNNHVIENATDITVTLVGGTAYHAKIIGTDPETDLAVVQISAPDLKAIDWGDSSQLHVGDYVAAIGNPFGLGQTVTLGIISALGRGGLGIEGYENFIQTDASINPGNSGGALIDMGGKLIGINSAIIGPSGGNVGIGFAIPVSMAKGVMNELIKNGAIRRGLLGVAIQDLDEKLAKALRVPVQKGGLVSQVDEHSPAEIAGMKPGDVVVAINGTAVNGAAELRNTIGAHAPGDKLSLTLMREKQEVIVDVALGEQPQKTVATPSVPLTRGEGYLYGTVLGNPDGSNNSQGVTKGAIILSLEDNSRAATAGLQAGDVIIAINQRTVGSPEDVLRMSEQAGEVLLVSVRRDGRTRFVAIGS